MNTAVHSFETDGQSESPGALLSAERQRLGWSVGDVAAKMRMSIAQVDALERSDYARLPTGTFLRGFVRSYAKLLGLDPAVVLTLLENSHADGRRPPIVVPSQNIKITLPGERLSPVGARSLLIAALMLTLAAGFAYWWFFIKPGQSTFSVLPVRAAGNADAVSPPATSTMSSASINTQPGETVVAPPAPVPGTDPAADAIRAAQSEAVAQPMVEARAPAAAPVAASKVAVPAGSGTLRFVFSGESWIEVVGGNGRTLVSRKYQQGEVEQVVGKLPLSVVVGNAQSARLVFNDVNFDLTPHTNKASVARFTLK